MLHAMSAVYLIITEGETTVFHIALYYYTFLFCHKANTLNFSSHAVPLCAYYSIQMGLHYISQLWMKTFVSL